MADRKGRLGSGSVVLALLAAVIVVDQAMKWWAWRHVWAPEINTGGDILVGTKVGDWFADPGKGALLDLLDFVLLTIASWVLLQRRRSVALLVTGSLMIGGWSSNLLDRLGMHSWTAPGSARGAVDFIHLGGNAYNVADLVIIAATPAFLVAVSAQYLRRSAHERLAEHDLATPVTSPVGAVR
jgi:lipoprotein signal peptidase